MSILIDKNTKVITQGMTGAARKRAASVCVDTPAVQSYFTRILCNCGNLL